jgi:glycolate oxidase FAD binding subunit
MSDAESATLWRRLADFGWDEETTPVLGCRASVPPSGVPEVVETVESWEVPAALRPAIVSHPAHGTVLAGWFSDGDAYSGADVTLLARRFLDAVHAAGGTLVIEHCPTEVKSGLDVWDDPGPSVAIMRRLKEQYDPKRILNPGRYVGGI